MLIVRSALVPALMLLFGDYTWKLPKLIDRILPQLNLEGSVEHPDPPAAKHKDAALKPSRR